MQADVNTQLIDSLTVHHTNDPKDSAYYLIEMTNYLKRTYEVLIIKFFLIKIYFIYYYAYLEINIKYVLERKLGRILQSV
jgi:hypothetical protein